MLRRILAATLVIGGAMTTSGAVLAQGAYAPSCIAAQDHRLDLAMRAVGHHRWMRTPSLVISSPRGRRTNKATPSRSSSALT